MCPRETEEEPRFVIRPSPLGRVWKALIAANCVFLGFLTLACLAARVAACVLISGGVLALVGWIFIRRPRLAVLAYDDELVVRNLHGGLTIRRAEIADFRVETPSLGTALRTNSVVGPVVHAVKRDGTMVPLKPTAMKFPDDSLGNNLTLLCEWLRDSD